MFNVGYAIPNAYRNYIEPHIAIVLVLVSIVLRTKNHIFPFLVIDKFFGIAKCV